MNIKETVEIGLEHISDSHRTKNGVGLCYFEPLSEVLLEFNETTKIPVYPTEKVFRKFYIVKDDFNLNINTIAIKAHSSSSEYSVKTLLEKSEELVNITPEGNTLIEFMGNYTNGIIPIYLYIESKTTSYLEVDLNIELEVL